MEVNSTIEVDVRFILKQCDCGELTNVKITKSNKNNNRGRIYYLCKRQRSHFLGLVQNFVNSKSIKYHYRTREN
ncbi:hypothetical protein LguiB_001133 [Lonicera macranthoides]